MAKKRQYQNPVYAIESALDRLRVLGEVDTLVATLIRAGGANALLTIAWIGGHLDRDKTAALKGLMATLDPKPATIPRALADWLTGAAPAPCLMTADVVVKLRAQLVDTRPEPSLFDGIDPLDVEEFA